MKIEDLDLWDFIEEPFEGCYIKCPKCNEMFHHEEWAEGRVSCEECGSHVAMVCPGCGEEFDHVWGPAFEVYDIETIKSLDGIDEVMF